MKIGQPSKCLGPLEFVVSRQGKSCLRHAPLQTNRNPVDDLMLQVTNFTNTTSAFAVPSCSLMVSIAFSCTKNFDARRAVLLTEWQALESSRLFFVVRRTCFCLWTEILATQRKSVGQFPCLQLQPEDPWSWEAWLSVSLHVQCCTTPQYVLGQAMRLQGLQHWEPSFEVDRMQPPLLQSWIRYDSSPGQYAQAALEQQPGSTSQKGH